MSTSVSRNSLKTTETRQREANLVRSFSLPVPALRLGIRVLTEKPMTTDAAKCRRILEVVEETKGSCQGESRRFFSLSFPLFPAFS